MVIISIIKIHSAAADQTNIIQNVPGRSPGDSAGDKGTRHGVVPTVNLINIESVRRVGIVESRQGNRKGCPYGI